MCHVMQINGIQMGEDEAKRWKKKTTHWWGGKFVKAGFQSSEIQTQINIWGKALNNIFSRTAVSHI